MSKETNDLKNTDNIKPMSAPQALAADGEKLSNASSTHGATLEYKEGEEWVKVANLKTITPPQTTTDEIETTDHDSNGWKQFIPGLKDGGAMPFSINVNNETNVTKLYALAESGVTVEWRITVPTKPKNFIVELKGFVKSFNIDEVPANPNAVTATGEIRNSGQPTYKWEA